MNSSVLTKYAWQPQISHNLLPVNKIMTKNIIEDGKDYLLFFLWPPSPGTSLTYLTLHLYMV